MNAKSSVLSLVSLRPTTIRDIVRRLPYARATLYEAVESLVNDGRLVRTREEGRAVVAIPSGHGHRKLQQLYLKALSHGIDPQRLTREGTIAVWRGLGPARTVRDLVGRTGLSPKWVRRVLAELEGWGLVAFEKRRPIIARLVGDHPVNLVLGDMFEEPGTGDALLLPGSFPFAEELATPRELERLLLDWMGGGLLIRDTDFQVLGGGGPLTVLDSVPRRPTLEETFLRMLTRPEGVEDICVRILASGRLDHEELLDLAVGRGMVNVVGCYLELVRDIGVTLDEGVVEMYLDRREDRVATFLESERAFGKSGWEGPYEERWGVDIYLDRGAIRHGVGSS
jgi:DNA-binding MarR family transcriptional regulator